MCATKRTKVVTFLAKMFQTTARVRGFLADEEMLGLGPGPACTGGCTVLEVVLVPPCWPRGMPGCQHFD